MNPDPDLTIVLLGKSGVGKSASGNTILGRAAFESKMSLKPVTKRIHEERGTVFGKQISVVDTPGILNTEDTEQEIREFCQELLQSSRRCLFLVVIRVGRFTDEDQKAVRAARRVLGPQGLKHSYLLFTGGDALRNRSLEDLIFQNENKSALAGVVEKFAGAYHLFNNEGDDKEQVRELLLKSGHLRTQQIPDSPDLTIVLLGKSGVGKSASGNTILGRTAFESKMSLKPVTKQIHEERGTVFGKQISVVDTPGILETRYTEQEIAEFCQRLLQSSRRCLFLVVIRVGRFTDEDQKAVRAARRVLGPQGLKHSYLLFTGGDALRNRSLEDFIFDNEDEGTLPDVVRRFSGAYHLFNNKNDDEEQVRELLLKSGHLRTQQPPDPPADVSRNRRMILLGRPGGGKSSSGNTILGSEKFKSGYSFNSVNTETVSGSATAESRQVTVVDTPGFTDQVLTPKQLYMEIMKSILKASPGPHAFIIVVRIGRISEADVKLFELLPKLFNSDVCDAFKYSMVLFTHGDQLEDQSMDDLIQSNEHVKNLVSLCGGRFCVFDNKTRRPRQQVRKLLNQIDEMVTANGGQHFTSDMFRMVQTFIREERNLSGWTAGQTASQTAGRTAGRTAGETAGRTAGGTAGGTAGETAGETAGRTAGRTAGETAGETAGRTAGRTASETAGQTASRTAGQTASRTSQSNCVVL